MGGGAKPRDDPGARSPASRATGRGTDCASRTPFAAPATAVACQASIWKRDSHITSTRSSPPSVDTMAAHGVAARCSAGKLAPGDATSGSAQATMPKIATASPRTTRTCDSPLIQPCSTSRAGRPSSASISRRSSARNRAATRSASPGAARRTLQPGGKWRAGEPVVPTVPDVNVMSARGPQGEPRSTAHGWRCRNRIIKQAPPLSGRTGGSMRRASVSQPPAPDGRCRRSTTGGDPRGNAQGACSDWPLRWAGWLRSPRPFRYSPCRHSPPRRPGHRPPCSGAMPDRRRCRS